MATVTATLDWATVKNELLAYMGLQESGTTAQIVKLLFDAAVAAADAYMENPFVDSTGANVTQSPEIKLGVYEYCRVLYKYLKGQPHLKAVKTLQIAETFRDDTAPVAAMQAARGYWVKYKLDLTLDGSWK